MQRGTHLILNGQLLPREQAVLQLDDLGFLVGDGVFETLRTYDGVPFLIEEHLGRLFASLRLVRLEIPWTRDQLLAQVRLLLEANAAPSGGARLRITVSRGPGAPPRTPFGRPTVLLTADPYEPPEAELYDRGVEVEMSKQVRHPHPLHRVKAISYLPNLWLRREASSERSFEVLQWSDAGLLTEGSFTNVFVVDAPGVLRTPLPQEGCLKGVTRNAVLTIAEQTGLHVHEGGIDAATLAGAREVFLTGSLVEIVPVRSIDGRAVGGDCPGPMTTALRTAYGAFVRSVVGKGGLGAYDA
jgi:branched-chain amino acid aminotransferase